MAWLSSLIDRVTRRPGGGAFAPAESGRERRTADRSPVESESVNLEWRDSEGRWRVEPVEACDVSENGLGLLVEHCFEPGQIVYVLREDAPTVQGAVRHVREAGDSYRVGLALIPRERRRMDRIEAGGHAAVYWTSREGESREVKARVRNVSDGGLQIECSQRFSNGFVVRLRGSNVECLASVRYCADRGDSYCVGLQMIGEPTLDPSAE